MDSHCSYRKCKPLARYKANILSRLTFWWLLPTLFKGNKGELTKHDLQKVESGFLSSTLSSKLEREWEEEQMRNPKHPSLFKAIWRAFGARYLWISLFSFSEECIFKILQPLSMMFLIRYLDSPTRESSYYGYLMTSALILSTVGQCICDNVFFHLSTLMSMELRIACSSMLYRKTLRMSKEYLNNNSIGRVTNLMTNDVFRFETAAASIPFLWNTPIQCILCTALLWPYLGVSSIVGLVVMALSCPIQEAFSRKFMTLREKAAPYTDKRIQLMDSIIGAMKVIKMYAWEIPFINLIHRARLDEVKVIKSIMLYTSFNISTSYAIGRLVLFLVLIPYVFLRNVITAEIIFTCISVFNLFKLTLGYFFPLAFNSIGQTKVSLQRIQSFLLSPDIEPSSCFMKVPSDSNCAELHIHDIDCRWDNRSDRNTLSRISLAVTKGQLLAIVGEVGAGKSSLLEAILGEMHVTNGRVMVRGDIAYASQTPWIFNSTLRQNILFGLPFDMMRYSEVLIASAMLRDLELLPLGDFTIVGDQGQNLSGGQKARLSLARALYRDADIYLLDDPLSAVDSHVGRHIFNKCMKGFLKNKLVVLVTHQLQYLRTADRILVLSEGKLDDFGTYEELVKRCSNFKQHESKEEEANIMRFNYELEYADNGIEEHRFTTRKNISSSMVDTGFNLSNFYVNQESKYGDINNYDDETVHVGVSRNTYWRYITAGSGWKLLVLLLILNLLAEGSMLTFDLILAEWTSRAPQSTSLADQNISKFFLVVLGVVLLIIIITVYTRTIFFLIGCVICSNNAHNQIFIKIIQAPLRFFSQNPIGVILNRFSKDLGVMDDVLPINFNDTAESLINALFSLVLVIITNYWLVIPTVTLCFALFLLRRFYLPTARSLKRIEASCRDSMFGHLSASLEGISNIRAYCNQDICTDEFDNHQNLYTSALYFFTCSSRWLAIIVDAVVCSYISAVAFSFLETNQEFLGSKVGLSLSSLILVSSNIQWLLRQSCEVENNMTSVERVFEYTNLTTEDPHLSKIHIDESIWPSSGEIAYKNVYLTYDDKSYVLHNLNFVIHPSEKIGIVGRTGAGKSSLITTLFRLAEAEGDITIDGVKTTDISLHELRSKISIIPQDPVLFTGSFRSNLDPFDEYMDDEIWAALDEAKLKNVVKTLKGGIWHEMSEGGLNLSVGQRQLVCLARAILRKNKILVLDEATANVDLKTDKLIQATIRSKFQDCTVLTIAHRLDTVLDADRIMVFESGKIVEFDNPHTLLKDKNGKFYKLAEQAGCEKLLMKS